MSIIHISQDEAISNFSDVIAKVRAGGEVCIDEDARTIAVVRAPFRYEQPRLLSEVIAGLGISGKSLLMDGKFGDDVEEGIRSRAHERVSNPWELS